MDLHGRRSQQSLSWYFKPRNSALDRAVSKTLPPPASQRPLSRLERLPIEVLELICDLDDEVDLRPVRQTSKTINWNICRLFALRHFGTLTVRLDDHDPHRLISIAKHDIFSKAVQTIKLLYPWSLDITPWEVEFADIDPQWEENEAFHTDVLRVFNDVNFRERITDWDGRTVTALLAEGLRNLGTLDSLQLVSPPDDSPNLPRCVRECIERLDYITMRHYGVPSLSDHVVDVRWLDDCANEPSPWDRNCFLIAVSALNAANINLSHLKVGNTSEFSSWGPDSRVTRNDLVLPGAFDVGYEKILRGLQSLELQFACHSLEEELAFRSWFKHVPSLRAISLHSTRDMYGVGDIHMLNVLQKESFKSLCKLKLQEVVGRSEHLFKILISFLPTLSIVGLEKIHTEHDGAKRFMGLLAKSEMRLTEISLSWIYEHSRQLVLFRDRVYGDSDSSSPCLACGNRRPTSWYDYDPDRGDQEDCGHVSRCVRGEDEVHDFFEKMQHELRIFGGDTGNNEQPCSRDPCTWPSCTNAEYDDY